MGDSILTSIKKLLGLPEEYEHFDADITMHINAVFMILTQLGIGKPEGFVITDKTQTWNDFLPNGDLVKVSAIKSYMFMKVKLAFDPPQSSFVIESYNKLINEYEWRMNINVDNVNAEPENSTT